MFFVESFRNLSKYFNYKALEVMRYVCLWHLYIYFKSLTLTFNKKIVADNKMDLQFADTMYNKTFKNSTVLASQKMLNNGFRKCF